MSTARLQVTRSAPRPHLRSACHGRPVFSAVPEPSNKGGLHGRRMSRSTHESVDIRHPHLTRKIRMSFASSANTLLYPHGFTGCVCRHAPASCACQQIGLETSPEDGARCHLKECIDCAGVYIPSGAQSASAVPYRNHGVSCAETRITGDSVLTI